MLPTLDKHRTLRLTTLCALYAAQGMPDGFVRVGLKAYLIDQGVSTAAVGNMVALVSWPWALKWAWGPVIDRYRYNAMGRRRPWILAAQLGLALTLGAMIMMPDLAGQLWWLGFMVLIANMFASLQDVSVDALAVDLLPEKERGIANGFMFASSYFGQYVGAAVLGGLLLTSGIKPAATVQMLILLSIASFPLLFREQPDNVALPKIFSPRTMKRKEKAHTIVELFEHLAKAFSVRSSLLAGLLALSSLIAVMAHLVFWPAFLQRNLGWSSLEYLQLEGNYAVWFGLVGSVGGGVLASAIGAKRTIAIAMLLLASTWLAHAAFQRLWESHLAIAVLFLAATAVAGLLQVAMFALFMGVSWPPVAATQFTAYMAMLNVSNGIGAKLAGHLEAAFDMRTIFIVLGVYQLGTLAILAGIDPEETRRRLGEEEPARRTTD
jgi:PAT family beta-lactamase induction signal transducer AmpG